MRKCVSNPVWYIDTNHNWHLLFSETLTSGTSASCYLRTLLTFRVCKRSGIYAVLLRRVRLPHDVQT